MTTIKLHRPTPEKLGVLFQAENDIAAPATNKIYTSDATTYVRAVAEYEPMGGVVIAYTGTTLPANEHKQLPPTGSRTFGIPNELIVKMQQNDTDDPVHVFVLCADADEKDNIIDSLTQTAHEQNISFNPDLVHLIPWDTDTYWTRDFSPWWVQYKDVQNKDGGRFAIAKHIYTSLGGGSVGLVEGAEEVTPRQGSGIFRCNDDYGAVKISDFLNAPIRKHNNAIWGKDKSGNDVKLPHIDTHNWFFTGLLDVGGNYMTTSNGTIASSYLVATQNELPIDTDPENPNPSPETLDERMKYIMEQTNRFLGASTYHVFTDPTGTYIGHIDCWGKFLSDKKVLIAQSEDKKTNAAFDEIEKAFSNSGFEVHRVLCQNIYVPSESDEPATTAAYTNSLILNKHVYVPMAGEAYAEYDNAAIAAYKEALPGYTIHGIIGKPETPWLGTDALHCRTNAIPRTVVNNWLESMKPTHPQNP
jgi:agmatine deiminase